MQTPERKQPPALLFDSSIADGIDQVLALAMLLSYDSKREIRIASLSLSRNNLQIAEFCDLMSRFYETAQTIGMNGNGAKEDGVPPMLSAVLSRRTPEGKPAYPRNLEKLNDTADPVALIRNALTAQQDQSFTMVLAGSPANLLGVLALPEGRKLVQKKVRSLLLAGPFDDRAGITTLLELWPGAAIFVSEGIARELQFPAISIEQDFTWAAMHPVVDAYRSTKTPAVDAPAGAMAAVLYAVHPDEGYFGLSDPGEMTVLANGHLQFTAHAQGRHRQLIMDATQNERVVQVLRQIVSSKPPEARRGNRGPQP
jgi:hypothetical protein